MGCLLNGTPLGRYRRPKVFYSQQEFASRMDELVQTGLTNTQAYRKVCEQEKIEQAKHAQWHHALDQALHEEEP